MLEHDLDKLTARDAASLDGLEAAIWKREKRHLAARQAARTVASWQAAILILGVTGSGVFGLAAATQLPHVNTLRGYSDSAPSVRLFGHRP